MNKTRIIQFRAGTPDKIHMFTKGDYELVKKDGVNLCDYSRLELASDSDNTLYLCSDEGDIEYANKLPLSINKRIILPKYSDGNVILYKNFVPKDSPFYQNLTKHTEFSYPAFKSYTPEEFSMNWNSILLGKKRYAIKVAIGSGSRGVYVINPDYKFTYGTREHYNQLTESMIKDVVEKATAKGCNILVQDLANDYDTPLDKFDVDLIMRNGKLVAYKWSLPDGPSTNWDHGYFLRNSYTDSMIESMVNYLRSMGVQDAMIGFDGYTNYQDICTLIEVNFRQQNCFFMFEAFDLDFIEMYLHPEVNWMSRIPYGKVAHVRYWRCCINTLPKGK